MEKLKRSLVECVGSRAVLFRWALRLGNQTIDFLRDDGPFTSTIAIFSSLEKSIHLKALKERRDFFVIKAASNKLLVNLAGSFGSTSSSRPSPLCKDSIERSDAVILIIKKRQFYIFLAIKTIIFTISDSFLICMACMCI
jgi:hypothetical protein